MKLVVTCRNFLSSRQTYLAIRRLLPRAEIRRSGFRGVFLVEAEGEPMELARELNKCSSVGRAVPVVAEAASDPESVKQAALRVSELVGEGESFSFRLHKRGSHQLEKPTPELEREIGAELQKAIERRTGVKPEVELEAPDVEISAEVLGPVTYVGILRGSWRFRPRGR
jgi:tRNA(Ser,Leu) C12 N-acetylase TAN1